MADRLRRCQLSSPMSVINFWLSAAVLITSTVEICIQHLGRVEEMVFTARCSYASAVLGVVILSICHMHALWLIQRTYRRYFYTTWKGNPSSQMWFFVQLCSSWQDFNWLKASRGPSAIAELLVIIVGATDFASDCADDRRVYSVRYGTKCLASAGKLTGKSSRQVVELVLQVGNRFPTSVHNLSNSISQTWSPTRWI